MNASFVVDPPKRRKRPKSFWLLLNSYGVQWSNGAFFVLKHELKDRSVKGFSTVQLFLFWS